MDNNNSNDNIKNIWDSPAPKKKAPRSRRGLKLPDILGIILVLGIILFSSTAVVTNQNEYSMILQFAEIVKVVDEPGLTFKIPFIQTVETREKNILFYDLPKSEVITSDKKTMIVDSYILWHITDPVKYYQTLSGLKVNAEGRIDTVVYNAIKNTISSMTQEEVIVSRDGKINVTQVEVMPEIELPIEEEEEEAALITTEADSTIEIMSLTDEIATNLIDTSDYGIEIIKVEVKALDLPDSNKDAVYNRMISEREKVKTMYTSEGESQAQIIRNTADREVSVMLSQAKADAAEIIAAGEAEYMRILSTAYNDAEKSEFYEFMRSLEAAKLAYQNNNQNTIILDRDSPLAEIFYNIDSNIDPDSNAAGNTDAESPAAE